MKIAGKLRDAVKGLGAGVKSGYQKGEQIMDIRQKADKQYRQSVFDPRYATDVNQGVSVPGIGDVAAATGPAEVAGAYAARLGTDLGSDSSRQFYWRYNHPMAIAEGLRDASLGAEASAAMKGMTPTKQALVGAVSLGIPAAATMGTFDLGNLGELGRPKGFAQNYTEKGAEDRRQTNQPGLEAIERFAMGRRGRPLKYDTAKEEIPDLTRERYGNYMRHKYQDKGLFGLGLIKGTGENLQGVPEASVVGFPVTAPMVGAVAGGVGGLRAAAARGRVGGRAMALAGSLGALGGIGAGKAVNMAVAQANRPDPASTSEYAQMKGQRHLPTQGLY